MKSAFLYTKFIIALLFVAFPAAGQAAAPSIPDSVKVLDVIRSVCKDAWCEEAAFSFDFQKVTLKPAQNETEVLFRLTQRDPVRLDSAEGSNFRAQINIRGVYDVSCVLPGYSTYDSIVQGEKFLRRDVRAALTDCIEALKNQVSQPL